MLFKAIHLFPQVVHLVFAELQDVQADGFGGVQFPQPLAVGRLVFQQGVNGLGRQQGLLLLLLADAGLDPFQFRLRQAAGAAATAISASCRRASSTARTWPFCTVSPVPSTDLDQARPPVARDVDLATRGLHHPAANGLRRLPPGSGAAPSGCGCESSWR